MESHFRLWIKENEVYIAGAMAHIRCVFKMQDSENEAIILLQLEDYKNSQNPSYKVVWRAIFIKHNLIFGLVCADWAVKGVPFHRITSQYSF